MIKITSLYPFQNFLNVTQEFYEDKATVKAKSFTFEQSYEFEYKNIIEIIDSIKSEYSQVTFSFWFLGFSSFLSAVFHKFIYTHLPLLQLEQALYVFGLIVFITAFKRTRRIYFLDKNNNTLAFLKQTRQNQHLVHQIIEIIKNKVEDVEEHTTTSPFPKDEYEFEHIEYNLSDLSKTTERFYKDKLVGHRHTLFDESMYNIQYNRLNGKILRGKSGNDFAQWVLFLSMLLASIFGGFVFGFALPYHIQISMSFLYTIIGLLILSLILLPMKFIKREVIGLYNKNGNIEYSVHINRNNRAKIEKIMEFIQSKIPIEERE